MDTFTVNISIIIIVLLMDALTVNVTFFAVFEG